MRSYHLKIADREQGPYGEAEVAQMFADRRIDRNTPCKPANTGDWKTIDDFMPMLKYGTQLPPPSPAPGAVPPVAPPSVGPASPTVMPAVVPAGPQRTTLVDIDISFGSLL